MTSQHNNISFSLKAKVEIAYYFNALLKFFFHKKNKENVLLNFDFLDSVFKKEKSDSIFVHAGLSRLKSIQGVKNPYEYLLTSLKNNYKNILVPAFTPSCRRTGIFSKKYSIPEYGQWSKLFYKESTFRTNDVVHSICGLGEFDFSECNHEHSFDKDSCFYKLIEENVLVANIGTDDFVCTFLHVLECIASVPYIESDFVKCELYINETEHYEVLQKNYKQKIKYLWNRKKIVKDLKDNNILRDYSKNGTVIYFFYAKELFEFLMDKLTHNEYYLLLGGQL